MGACSQSATECARVDVEVARDPVTGRRRRVSRYVHGTREDAEIALARLRVADHEKRLPSAGTNARSVRAVFQLYLQAADSGLIELAPATVVTSRSAAKRMCSTVLADGRTFGDIRRPRLTWSDIESLYLAMRAAGGGSAWVRRCATVLGASSRTGPEAGLIVVESVKGCGPTSYRAVEALCANGYRGTGTPGGCS